ncbi:hypothetical protein FUA23_02665 [Neolewinella aurantiaca]|uniref:DUF6438 domain-containing protein n=1 Tax=Neolewinella aurantiaca TaxID=2602767 RepID=A0A5C7FXE8_9BACT|nr:DUF6438 domain-containing protein [Neolewinella aurantiaca]TXF91149.1 hypothetical protein FUA23_02665 [Neolewinella aurantiaca]
MRILSTLLSLSFLLVFSFGCNKDAASTGNDPFLAPATAPDLPKRNSVDSKNLSREGLKEQEAADDGSEDIVKLTPEDAARAKRMGPGRISPSPATKSDQPVTAGSTGTTPASMPAPGSKPALDYDRAIFAISKTACYGGDKCRQFGLELTNDRRLILDAKRNMDLKGKYSRMLSATEYNKLLSAMEASEPERLEMVYPTDKTMIPADAQATILRYADVHGTERKIEVYADAPKQLAKLLADLESWVDKDGWIKMAE